MFQRASEVVASIKNEPLTLTDAHEKRLLTRRPEPVPSYKESTGFNPSVPPRKLLPHPPCSTLFWHGCLSTYMHLRVKFFCRGGRVGSPGGALVGEVVCAVVGVPGVFAAGPGQLTRERGDEVVQGPCHDGVVVRGNVEANDADGIANSWIDRKCWHKHKRDGCSGVPIK